MGRARRKGCVQPDADPVRIFTQALGRWMVMRSSGSVIAKRYIASHTSSRCGQTYSALPITDNAFRSGAGEICTAPSSGRFISRIR